MALAAGLLLSGWVLGSRPDLARVSIEGHRLIIRPKGMARILAFHRSLMFSSDNQTGIVFMLAGRAHKFLRIDLGRGKIRYLVVQVADPESLAAELLAGGRP